MAAEGAFVDDLTRMTALYVSLGGLVDGATRAQVDALYAAGARVHYVDVIPRPDGGPIPFAPWGPDIDFVVAPGRRPARLRPSRHRDRDRRRTAHQDLP